MYNEINILQNLRTFNSLQNQLATVFGYGSTMQKSFDNFKILETFVAPSNSSDYNIGFTASMTSILNNLFKSYF